MKKTVTSLLIIVLSFAAKAQTNNELIPSAWDIGFGYGHATENFTSLKVINLQWKTLLKDFPGLKTGFSADILILKKIIEDSAAIPQLSIKWGFERKLLKTGRLSPYFGLDAGLGVGTIKESEKTTLGFLYSIPVGLAYSFTKRASLNFYFRYDHQHIYKNFITGLNLRINFYRDPQK